MKKHFLLTILLTVIMSACKVQTPPIPTELAPASEATLPALTNTPSVVVTEQPASPGSESPEPTSTEQTTSSGTTLYRIVVGESKLQYEVGEVFLNQNNRFNVAVGVTTQINGDIIVDLADPTKSSLGPLTADISQFTSDNNRRDNALRDRFIESNRYPTVTFVVNEITGLPDSYQPGQQVQLLIVGDLTIRETTRPVTFDAIVSIQADTLTGEATTTILMSDFGFGPIDIAGILKTEDEAKVTLNLVARP